MVIICLLVLVAYFILVYFDAKWFYEVAEKKGHHDKKYFWICFWLGIVGFLLVIALPDRSNGQAEVTDLPEL